MLQVFLHVKVNEFLSHAITQVDDIAFGAKFTDRFTVSQLVNVVVVEFGDETMGVGLGTAKLVFEISASDLQAVSGLVPTTH